MFCRKCGAKISDDSAFCEYCGAPAHWVEAQINSFTGASNQNYSAMQYKVQTYKKMSRKIKFRIILCAVMAVILTFVVICIQNYVYSPERAVGKYVKAITARDIEEASTYSVIDAKGIYNKLFDEMKKNDYERYHEVLGEYDIKDIDEYWEHVAEEQDEWLDNKYGKGLKITVEVKDIQKLSDNKADEVLEGIKEEMEDADLDYDVSIGDYADLDKITDVCKIEFEVAIWGRANFINYNDSVYVAKSGIKWKVLDMDILDTFG